MMESLREIWPDDDRRDAGLERLLLRVHGGIRYRNPDGAPMGSKAETDNYTVETFKAARRGGELSDDHKRVLLCISHGLSNPEISVTLGLGFDEVKDSIVYCLRTFAAKTRAQAACEAIRQGIID